MEGVDNKCYSKENLFLFGTSSPVNQMFLLSCSSFFFSKDAGEVVPHLYFRSRFWFNTLVLVTSADTYACFFFLSDFDNIWLCIIWYVPLSSLYSSDSICLFWYLVTGIIHSNFIQNLNVLKIPSQLT